MIGVDSGEQALRVRRCARALAWKHVYFFPSLARVWFVESTEMETARVNIEGRIEVNPEFFASLSDTVVAWIVAHELLHLMLLHHLRSQGRDFDLWGDVCDMAINQMIREMGGTLTGGALYPPPGLEMLSADELYGQLAKSPKKPRKGPARIAEGCGVSGPGAAQPGKAGAPGGGGEGTAPGLVVGVSSKKLEGEWKEISIQAQALAAGSIAGRALARLTLAPPTRVKWETLIRTSASRVQAAHGRDDQTWTRISRRSPPGILLPGWTASRGLIAVILDSSGSVSDKMLADEVAQTTKIAETTKGVRIFLVIHDAAVHFAGWLHAKTPEEVAKLVRGRGGTHFGCAYRRCEEENVRFDTAIHLTDGIPCDGGGWPEVPTNARGFIVGQYGNGRYSLPDRAKRILVE